MKPYLTSLLTCALMLSGCTVGPAVVTGPNGQQLAAAGAGGSTTVTPRIGGTDSGPIPGLPPKLKFTQLPLATGGAVDWQATDFDHVYAVLGNKVTITVDAGRNWSTKTIGTNPLHTVFFADAMHGWVGGSNGVLFRTEDGGETWTLVDTGHSQMIWDLAFADQTNGFMLASGLPADERAYALSIYKTTDGGKTWDSTPVRAIDYRSSLQEQLTNGDFQSFVKGGHNDKPRLFVDSSKKVWCDLNWEGKKGLSYYHDGAFETVLELDTAQEVVAKDRVYFLRFNSQNLAGVQYSEDYQTLKQIGPDFVSPSQIHRNLGITNLVHVDDTIRVFSKYKDMDTSYYMDSTDSGKTWTDPRDVDGILPTQIVSFDLNHSWGFDAGRLYRSGL